MALSWGAKRQFMIVMGFLGIILVIAGIIIVPKLQVKPTCFDGKQNGDEQGIDCGGSCQKLCKTQTTDVVVKWARVFPVTDSVANAVAYISNPNVVAAAENVPYNFRIYDANHQFITERNGTAYIAPNGASAIFEGGIQVGTRVPVYAEFKFTADPLWVTTDSRVRSIQIVASDPVLEAADSRPKVTTSIRNTSTLYGVNDVYAIAILYDAQDNAVGVSQTYLPSLAPADKQTLYFTWPKPFANTPVREEILPRFDVLNFSSN